MHKFAASLSPLEIHLTRIQAIPTRIDNLETGILWFDVEESSALRETHNLMNAELEHRFGPTPAPFDGDAYHFHLTIAMGDQPMELYNRSAKFFKSRYANLHFTASELAMFVYDENAGLGGGYMTYIILPLGK
jgi:2'-5' RNA ligase